MKLGKWLIKKITRTLVRARATRRGCRRRGRTEDAQQTRCVRTAGFGLKATGSAMEDLAALAGFAWNSGSRRCASQQDFCWGC
jgi:hypothetical protein